MIADEIFDTTDAHGRKVYVHESWYCIHGSNAAYRVEADTFFHKGMDLTRFNIVKKLTSQIDLDSHAMLEALCTGNLPIQNEDGLFLVKFSDNDLGLLGRTKGYVKKNAESWEYHFGNPLEPSILAFECDCLMEGIAKVEEA